MSQRERELEEENRFLKNQLESLQIKYEEILAELGKFDVEKTAKENQQRKSDLFNQIFHPLIREVEISPLSNRNDKPITDTYVGYPTGYRTGYEYCSGANGLPNSSHRPQTSNESASPPLNTSVFYPAVSNEQSVHGAEGLTQGSNHQLDKKGLITRNKSEKTGAPIYRTDYEMSPSTLNQTNIFVSEESARTDEGISQSETVKASSGLASTSRPGYEDLSFSVQQDDSGSESISLSNVPPTSVATTLYNNYKLLLLSLAQRLLSSEVVILKAWAAQNFSVNNPHNATDVLIQLDQKGVINASDFSQLNDFFESIIRFDLVYIIDAFLLGDYSFLCQTSASKRRDATVGQSCQPRATSMDLGLINEVNSCSQLPTTPAARGTSEITARKTSATSRKPENSDGAGHAVPRQQRQAAFRNSSEETNSNLVSRSASESESTAHERQNRKPAATGFTSFITADAAGAGPSVKSK